jgi:TonB family protein
MAITYAHRRWSPIGAIELKASYRKNMTIAMILIVSAIAVSIGTVATVQALTPAVQEAPKDTIFVDVTHLLPPPVVDKKPMGIAPPKQLPKIDVSGITPIDDESVFVDFALPTRGDYERIDTSGMGTNADAQTTVLVGVADTGGVFQPRGEFVPYDEQPVVISLPTPKYPEMARKASIEGRVRVEVLIDTYGKIRDARIVEESGANIGFEEAALEAAWKGEWRPAMQNKQPVAVRVSYQVVFRLK